MHKNTRMPARATALIAGIVGAGLLLSACSTGSPTTSNDPSASGSAGGTLVYATGDAEPACLDPHVGGNFPQALLSSQFLEPLFGRDEAGEILPWLATEWSVSDDGLVWDITLAEGVTFTDGTPFDAEAVKINIEHLQDPATQSSTGYLAVEKVASIEAVDATNVRFTLSTPDAALLESLSQPWTAMQSPAGLERGMEENCLAPIGTGPFIVESWTAQQEVELIRNDDYAGLNPQAESDGAAGFDSIIWRFIPDPATRYAALQSGQVNVIDNPEPGAIANPGEGITHINSPRPGASNRIELNSDQAPFDDIRVREAFIRAASVEPGIESLYQGTVDRSFSLLASTEPFAVSDESLFTTDIEAAKTLLDDAGWSEIGADGVRLKDGERLVVRFPVSTNQSVAAEQALFEQIQANALAVGFEVILTPTDLSAWYAALGANEYEAVSAPYTKVGADVLRILYHSDGIVPAPSGYFANHAKVNDPEIDALLETAATTSDADERREAAEAAQQLILEGYFVLPLYDQQNHYLTSGVERIFTLGTVGTPSFIDAQLTQ
ncbi:ABC transporter substrate-binding protein [Humidisolicoccus flavus]|uniref:ABC transporter substrate-binding protein n=1 Tax=Humidisolicoccus flavus TaxID=3111414 RepID=UPI003254BF37